MMMLFVLIYLRKKGDVIKAPKDCSDVLGFYLCKGDSFEAVYNRFVDVRKHFKIETIQLDDN